MLGPATAAVDAASRRTCSKLGALRSGSVDNWGRPTEKSVEAIGSAAGGSVTGIPIDRGLWFSRRLVTRREPDHILFFI